MSSYPDPDWMTDGNENELAKMTLNGIDHYVAMSSEQEPIGGPSDAPVLPDYTDPFPLPALLSLSLSVTSDKVCELI